MKDSINDRYVSKGEFREGILTQEVSEITGHHTKTASVGVLGGFIGQLILVIDGANNIAQKKDIKAMLEPRIIQNFLLLYIDAKMKTERFTF